MSKDLEHYNFIAIILHWVMAISFILMITSGLVMANLELDKSFQFQLYQWHKSLGVLLFLAFFIRIIWRVFFKPPDLPDNFSRLEAKASKLGHWSLYIWMFLLPLVGWVMVSASAFGLPTFVFGWFEWPHIPGIEANKTIEDIAKFSHRWLAYSFIALVVLHIAAVVKHAMIDKENLLSRMWFTGKAK